MIEMKKFFTLFLFLTLSLIGITAEGQHFETLFPYPTAPDTCTTLESRCNYSTQHFWDSFDATKQLKESEDSLLMLAMTDFLSILRQANPNIGLGAIRSLMFKARANQVNFMKLANAANWVLYLHNYGMRDEVYLTFVQAVLDASWLKKDQKTLYKDIARRINNTKLGAEIVDFNVTTASGEKRKFKDLPVDSAEIILLFFTGDDADSPLERTRLSADLGVNDLVAQGYAKVYNIYVGKKTKEHAAEATMFPSWTLLASNDAGNSLDVRFYPSFIVLDNKFTVMNKNIGVDAIKNAFNNQ